jgi:hypothetical protein
MIDVANGHSECVYEGSQWITIFSSTLDWLVAYIAHGWRFVPALGSPFCSDKRYVETNWLEEQTLEVYLLTRAFDTLWLWYGDRIFNKMLMTNDQ